VTLTYFKLFSTAFFWGGTFVAGRWLGESVHPYSSAFFRFAVASLFLLLLTCRREGRLPKLTPRQMLAVLALGATGVFAYNLFFFNGLQHVHASRAALIIALNPTAITLASALLYKEKLEMRRALGILLALCGAVMVITRGNPLTVFDGGIGRGELLIFGCVVSWTLYSIIGKKAMQGLTPLAAVSWSSLAGTALLLFPALTHGSFSEALGFGIGAWGSIVYLGLFGTVIGFFWYFEAIQKIGPSRAAVFINFVPVNGVLLATLLLGEPLTFAVLSGGSMVICGSYLANSTARKHLTRPFAET